MTTQPPTVTTTAAGQLLGYTLQFPRALCRLLQVGPDGAVGLEVLGDVDAYIAGHEIITEEDKSSTTGNPLTNRSTDLWKTFHNWIQAIERGAIDLNKTTFVLYCNHQGRPALVNRFDEVSTIEAARVAVTETVKELGSIPSTHDIWPYYDYVVNHNTVIFEQILLRFKLIIGHDSAHEEVRYELKKMCIQEASIEHVLNDICGWFQRVVAERLRARTSAIVKFDELRRHMSVLLSQIRQRELVDFAASELVLGEKIGASLQSRPVFIQQLDLIKRSEERKMEAVSDYLRADHNRNRWIQNETLDERTAEDFENRLYSFWQVTQRKMELLHSSRPEETRGELLLDECAIRQEMIRGESPPDRTIAGTYHALADRRRLGWHPRWGEKFLYEDPSNG